MPFITFTLLKGRSADEKKVLGDCAQTALMSVGVPEKDRFQRFIELESDQFIFDRDYPNLETPRSDQFIMIEILLSVGRSVKIKRELLKNLISNLQTRAGVRPHDVMVVMKETAWENWAFSDGEMHHV